MTAPSAVDTATPRSEGSRVFGQAAIVGVGRLGGAALQAVTFALVARLSGPAAFGSFAAVYGVVVVLQALFGFGLVQTIVSRRAAGRDRDPAERVVDDGIARVALRMSLCVTVAALMLTTVAALSLGMIFGVPAFVGVLVAWGLVDNYVESWLGLSLADGRVYENAIATIARRSVALLVVVVAVAESGNTALCAAVGLLAGSAIVLPLVIWRNKRHMPGALGLSWSVATYRSSRGFWINSLAVQLRNFDVAILAVTGASALAVGMYGAASRLVSPFRIIPTSFALVLMPHASRVGRSGARALLAPVLLVVALSSIVFASIAALSPFVIPMFLGDSYVDAVPCIQIICVGLVFASMASQFSSLLQGWGHTNLVATVAVISCAATFVGLGFVGGFGLGAVTAAVVLCIAFAVQALLLALFVGSIFKEGGVNA
ncbi:lipopolysaccharide biosynthesis protein [Gordonia sp. OPL2]|uniref:lipopolysaccharide biosynthesis protein n=1 Tax=Gordonia sp. OPL2 TaxID=2486274 RepID=UPI0021CCD406|nr:lipopolysaccharide biosynthesis protein [Gordonia sp. OPL2]ROZ85959.1 lipopolysaccharide biosynthesis protein [Gordonia sp. OPL2]